MTAADTPTMHRRRLALALVSLTLGVAGMAAPAAARAGTTMSDNWSGYADHGKGATFRSVSAIWRVPSGTCTTGTGSYSAFWVGLGGYALSAQALEQIGTEFDCSASGAVKLSAWYELVPAGSRSIQMTVDAGDKIRAGVSVTGEEVTLTLTDRTRHETFTRTILDHSIDVSSAEWIAEAPSDCSASGAACSTLPLADFGSVAFSSAQATTSAGRTGTVTSRLWDTTKIVLGAGGTPRFVSDTSSSAAATPSSLSNGGSAFTVAYTGTTSTSSTSTSGTGTDGSGSGTLGSGTGTGGAGSGPGGPGSGAGGPAPIGRTRE